MRDQGLLSAHEAGHLAVKRTLAGSSQRVLAVRAEVLLGESEPPPSGEAAGKSGGASGKSGTSSGSADQQAQADDAKDVVDRVSYQTNSFSLPDLPAFPAAKPSSEGSISSRADITSAESARPAYGNAGATFDTSGELGEKPAVTPTAFKYEVLRAPDQLPALAATIRACERVGICVRTSGSEPLVQPMLLAIALPNARVHVVDINATGGLGPLTAALEGVALVGYDLQPQLRFLKKHYGFSPPVIRCAKTSAKILDGGIQGSPGFLNLDIIARTHVVALDTGSMSLGGLTASAADLNDVALAAGDILELDDLLQDDLRRQDLLETAELENAFTSIAIEMELAGVRLDSCAWQQLVDSGQKTMAVLRRELTSALAIKNPDNGLEVLAALRRATGVSINAVRHECLEPFRQHPLVDKYLRYRDAAILVQNFGEPLLKALKRQVDGRLRPIIDPLGAATGRISCRSPNLMGLPKEARIRRCILPAEGHVFVCADYAAIELRVLAEVAEDQRLIECFAQGGDPHRLTASLLLGKALDAVTKVERAQAKPVNFGISFGMGAKTLVEYARDSFGVSLSEEEAERFRESFLAAYKGVDQWQAKMKETMPTWVRTVGGRWRLFAGGGQGYCERLNMPIQGTAADGMKRALLLMVPKLKALGARIVLSVHDEVLAEAPVEHAEEAKSVVLDCMKAGMSYYVKSVPIEVEASLRTTWAEEDTVERMRTTAARQADFFDER